MKLESNEKLAEMVGIFQGTGTIDKNCLIFSIDKDRKKYIHHVADLIESVIKIKPYKEPNGSKMKLVVNNPIAVRAFEVSWKQNDMRNCFFLYV